MQAEVDFDEESEDEEIFKAAEEGIPDAIKG
jgi:hypothetical protein